MVIYPWQQTKHGQECFDNFGSTDSSLLVFPPQLSSSHLPAELPPMLTVAATFLGYTANDPNKKKDERKQWVERGKRLKFIFLSAEDPVFETACKMDTNMTHGFWIK